MVGTRGGCLSRGCGHTPRVPTKTTTWNFHCGGLLPMECRQKRSFGRQTRPTARVPGFATNRAGPSRSVGTGRSLDVNGGLGSRECRVEVYWVAGATARSRRRRSVSRWCTRRLGHAIRFFGSIAGVWRPKELVYQRNKYRYLFRCCARSFELASLAFSLRSNQNQKCGQTDRQTHT